jgi:hypothetical protein
MCGESKTTQKSEEKTKSKNKQEIRLPGYVNQASKTAVDLATQQATQPVEAYSQPMVADLSGDTMSALGWLKNYMPESQLPGALQKFETYASAPAQQIETSRVVDESGPLGAIHDYMNPYIQEALRPQLEAIQDAWGKQNLRNRGMASMSGAYGDARHGILDLGAYEEFQQGTGDATAQAYQAAFDRAMGYRTGDLNRFMQTDLANAGFNETALDRMMKGGAASMDAATQEQQRELQLLQAKLQGGEMLTENEQRKLTASYGEWLRQQEEEQNRIKQLASVTAAVPTEKTVKGTQSGTTTGTATTTQPDNSGLQLAGSLGGALIKAALAPATGGASLMAPV